MELKKYKLEEIANIVNGATPSTSCEENYDGDIVWITPKDLSDQRSKYIDRGNRNITQKGCDSCSVQMIPAYNILMSSRAPIGLLAINTIECCTNQGFKNIIVDKSICDIDYLYYYLKYHIKEIEAIGSGTTFKEVSKTSLQQFEIALPALEVQKHIASILSNIDCKIELNRAINQNLEAMVKQLYDYWFVQFDFPDENGRPYKSNGGEMVWNKKLKREIPKGWNVLKLGERCSFNKRTSSGYFNHSILYLDTSNITNNTIDELQFLNPSSDIIPSRARRLVQEGDIVYSTVRPNLKHFGIIMNPDYNMVVSTGFAVITANWSAYRYFIYQFLIQAATIENLSTIAQSAVSAYPSINTSDIENLDLVVPPDSMIEEYAKISCRLYLQIDTNYKEIKSLTKQRDELLPLLMNGQVSVNSDLSDD